MATEVNITTASNYNSNAGGNNASGAVRQISGSGVVEHIKRSDYDNEMYRSDPTLRGFIETAPHAIIVTDEAGMVRACNPYAESMFGYSEDEVFGKPFAALLDPYNSSTPIGRSVFCSDPDVSKTPRNVETRARKKSGELFPVELVTNRLTLGPARVGLNFIRDISFRQRFEQRISELQKELIHLSQTNVLGELASAITHELNQPLAAITNYAAAARQCGCRATPEELESSFELMDKAANQAKRASQIMHKLRNLVQYRGIDCADADLRLVVEDAVQLGTLGSSHHRIKVSVEMPSEPVMVLMDRVQVQILLTNLVRNAVDELKRWDGAKQVMITLKVRSDQNAEVVVEDTGPGLSPEVFESIFEPFHTTKPDGLGMGLAISRRIAEAHDGRLSADNRPEGGAVFSFIVPMSSENMGE